MAEAVEAQLETNRRPPLSIVRDLTVAVGVVVLIWLGLRILRSETALDALGPLRRQAGTGPDRHCARCGRHLGAVRRGQLAGRAASRSAPPSVLRPYVFVGPAVVVLSIFLLAPAIGTIIQSFTEVPEGEGPLLQLRAGVHRSGPTDRIAQQRDLAHPGPGRCPPHRSRAFAGLVDRIKSESSGQVLHLHPALHFGSRGRRHLEIRLRVASPRASHRSGSSTP